MENNHFRIYVLQIFHELLMLHNMQDWVRISYQIAALNYSTNLPSKIFQYGGVHRDTYKIRLFLGSIEVSELPIFY